jgi:hypothetical protein
VNPDPETDPETPLHPDPQHTFFGEKRNLTAPKGGAALQSIVNLYMCKSIVKICFLYIIFELYNQHA